MLDGSFWREAMGYIFRENMGKLFKQREGKKVSLGRRSFGFIKGEE